ncbi:hypothetical protein [uncultured Sulfitobacter sp.]|uniref:hypothetical protein n=1 Tax=uncultured Sulfitobacter sp. TaxID=191468 RepID=UPI00261B14FA|nr:hypothetical protein [uncultured Sulfitobacter sp.]
MADPVDIPAQQALVAVSAYFALENLSTRDFDLWVGELRKVLDRCGYCVQSLFAIRAAASAVCDASAHGRASATAALRLAVRDYYALQAGARVEALRDELKVVE